MCLAAGTPARAAEPPRFSGERALALAVEFSALGPRVPGTGAHARGRDYLAAHLRRCGARVEFEEFVATGPSLYAPGTRLANVVARFNPDAPARVLLGAHWDSRPTADEDPDPRRRRDPVPGANDGASGTAVLLHLAEILHARPAPIGVDLVFFDGEDGGIPDSVATYCLGSREHVRRLGPPRPAYVIVVDMVGDRELSLPVEGYSQNYAPELVRMIWDGPPRSAAPSSGSIRPGRSTTITCPSSRRASRPWISSTSTTPSGTPWPIRRTSSPPGASRWWGWSSRASSTRRSRRTGAVIGWRCRPGSRPGAGRGPH